MLNELQMCKRKLIKVCVVLICVCNLSRGIEIPAYVRDELGEMICTTKHCARFRSEDNKIICDCMDDVVNDWNMFHIIPLDPPSIHCKEESFIAIKTSNSSLKYLMEIKSEENSTWKLLYKGNFTLKLIEDLNYQTKYKLRLWGVSTFGHLQGPSETDWLQTFPSHNIPLEVQSIQLEELVVDIWNNYEAVITWQPPETKSCYYELVWFSGHDYEHGQIDITNVTGDFEATITNLAYDSNYSVAIITKSSDWTKESNKTWLHFKTQSCWDIQSNLSLCFPATPQNVNVELFKNEHLYNLLVNWDAPYFLPDYYTVELTIYFSLYNNSHILLEAAGNSTSITFESVELGLHHQITVTAWSQAGSSQSIIVNQESPELNQFQHFDTNKSLKIFSFTSILSIVMIIIFIFSLILLCFQKSKKLEQSFNDVEMVEACSLTSLEDVCVDTKDNDQWEIDPNNIYLLSKLGEGAFGLVRKAKLIHKASELYVAVKMLKDYASVEDVRQFKKEIEIMKTVGSHPNIVSIIGCCTAGGFKNLKLIVEYCPGGNLLNYLRKFSNIAFIEPQDSIDYKYSLFEEIQTDSSDISAGLNFANIAYLIEGNDSIDCKLQLKDMLSIARQIANGMEYLASLRMVHRDLAARNVLVCEDNVVKVSDFGLSRDVYNDNVYVKLGVGKVPVRWMALESLTHQRYTTKSDVWSFGILLWEIFTMGGNPYPNFSDTLGLLDSLKAGRRMGCPHNCNGQIYDLMLNCWKENPNDRPNFTDIRQCLDILLEGFVSYVNVDPLPSFEKNLATENSNGSDWYVRPI